MMRKFFYGNPDKPDFTDENLPATRPALFRRVLIERYGQMFLLNLLYVISLLPALIWGFLSVSRFYAALDAEVAELSGLWLQSLAIWAPLWLITGPFTAGFAYVHGCWARDEMCPIVEGYKNGIHDNWRQALAVSAITAVLPLLLYCSVSFYLQMAQRSIVFMLPLVLAAIAALIWFSSLGTIWGMMTAYQMPLKQLLKNAVFLTLGNLLRSIGIRFLTLFWPVVWIVTAIFIPGALFLVSLVVLLLTLVIGLSFNRLIFASYSNYLTETYINAKIPGLPTRVGLRPVKKGEGE